jgi:hypothetical protein
MKREERIFIATLIFILITACATSDKARPLPLKSQASYGNAVEIAGALVAARAFADPQEAEEAFGFDIRGAGMLPVQVIPQ